MGIKGTVRRSTDGDFIHANVDIDLIIDEEAEPGECRAFVASCSSFYEWLYHVFQDPSTNLWRCSTS